MKEVRWSARAQKDLGRLDMPVRRRVLNAVERLAFTNQGDVRQLRDTTPAAYRLRVGDWRVVYTVVEQRILLIQRVLPRDKAYR